MTEMPQPESIQVLLAKVMSAVEPVAKRERNAAQNFNFRGIDSVVNAVAPALKRYGVIVTPHVIDKQYSVVEVGQKRTAMSHCLLTVEYTFHGPAGDSIATTVASEAMDSGDKATAKAMSVAFRIALLQALALPTDEPDPDQFSYERAPLVRPLDESHLEALQEAIASETDLEELRLLYKGRKDNLDNKLPNGQTLGEYITSRASELSAQKASV